MKIKVWFWRLLCHLAAKWIGPTLQLQGPPRTLLHNSLVSSTLPLLQHISATMIRKYFQRDISSTQQRVNYSSRPQINVHRRHHWQRRTWCLIPQLNAHDNNTVTQNQLHQQPILYIVTCLLLIIPHWPVSLYSIFTTHKMWCSNIRHCICLWAYVSSSGPN